MAWSLSLRIINIELTQAAIQSDVTSVKQDTFEIKSNNSWGDNFTHTVTEEPPSHTKGEKVDMDTEEAAEKEPIKELVVENIMQELVKAKAIKASSKVRPDPDEPVIVPYEIRRKLYHLTNDEIQEHLDKEEKMKKAVEEGKLLAMSKPELIKVVHEEASKARIDLKILINAKGGHEFKKIQDAEMKVLNREHSQKGVPFINNMVIEEPEFEMFFIDAFSDEAFQRMNDILKVDIETLLTYLVMASNITTSKNIKFCLKLRKLIEKHLDQEKLKSKKVKLESVRYKLD
nr:hypothetical protein [Tanacetum cinerariifolium]